MTALPQVILLQSWQFLCCCWHCQLSLFRYIGKSDLQTIGYGNENSACSTVTQLQQTRLQSPKNNFQLNEQKKVGQEGKHNNWMVNANASLCNSSNYLIRNIPSQHETVQWFFSTVLPKVVSLFQQVHTSTLPLLIKLSSVYASWDTSVNFTRVMSHLLCCTLTPT